MAKQFMLLSSDHEVGPGSNPAWAGSPLMTTGLCTKPFIITPVLSQYDVDDVGRYVKDLGPVVQN